MRKQFEDAGISLTKRQEQKFIDYYKMLIEWNKKVNLTSITQWEDVVEKHFLDSVIVKRFISFEKGHNKKCIDIGTGAGFPGLPFSILFPEVEMVLLDSLRKRVDFLDEVIKELRLKNVTTIHGRAEDVARETNYRENFDFVVSRAVANLSILSEYGAPFLKIGGKLILYKSVKVEDEVKEFSNVFSMLGCKLSDIHRFVLPGTDSIRNLVIIEKENHTNQKYPRRAGKPSKKPLK